MDTAIRNKIKSIRELKNYTQEYMANQLGITQAGYSKIESGKTDLAYTKLEKIADILEVSLEAIIYFDSDRYFNCVRKDFQENTVVNNNHSSGMVGKLYEDKVVLLEELLHKTCSDLQRYKEKFGVI